MAAQGAAIVCAAIVLSWQGVSGISAFILAMAVTANHSWIPLFSRGLYSRFLRTFLFSSLVAAMLSMLVSAIEPQSITASITEFVFKAVLVGLVLHSYWQFITLWNFKKAVDGRVQ